MNELLYIDKEELINLSCIACGRCWLLDKGSRLFSLLKSANKYRRDGLE